jgi:hypothetical protein
VIIDLGGVATAASIAPSLNFSDRLSQTWLMDRFPNRPLVETVRAWQDVIE